MNLSKRLDELEQRAARVRRDDGRYDLSRLSTSALMELRSIVVKQDAGEPLTDAERQREREILEPVQLNNG